MVDINTIKNLINFLPYLKRETWYMLAIGIIVYVIYIGYLIAFERYNKMDKPDKSDSVQKVPISIGLQNLKLDDIAFFTKLSFLLRSHLEDSCIVMYATKKTQKDLETIGISKELKDILRTCSHYEYTNEEATIEIKKGLITGLRKVL